MSKKQSASRLPQLGKLSVAVIEHLVQPAIGDKAINEIKAPLIEKELRVSLAQALTDTEKRFVAEHADSEVCEAILNLPLANLPTVLQAVRDFYSRPTNTSLSQILRDQMAATLGNLPSERIDSGVSKYLRILRDELTNLSGEIREKLTAQATLVIEDNTSRMANALERIEQHLGAKGAPPTVELKEPKHSEAEISVLISKAQSRTVPLSQCLAEALALARKANNMPLEDFCRNELSGYIGEGVTIPPYRVVDIFISPLGRLNTQHILWNGSPTQMFDYMRRQPDKFFPYRLGLAYSVSRLESLQNNVDANSANGVISFPLTMGDIVPNAENSSGPTPAYAEADSILLILDSIRHELTNMLLAMLPRTKGAG